MSIIKEILLKDGTAVYVEMESAEVSIESRSTGSDLPPGVEEVTAVEKVVDTIKSLQSTLHVFFDAIHEGVKTNAPDEWGAEINIGFKGKVNPIPVIVGGESNVAIKVHAKWVKPVKP